MFVLNYLATFNFFVLQFTKNLIIKWFIYRAFLFLDSNFYLSRKQSQKKTKKKKNPNMGC